MKKPIEKVVEESPIKQATKKRKARKVSSSSSSGEDTKVVEVKPSKKTEKKKKENTPSPKPVEKKKQVSEEKVKSSPSNKENVKGGEKKKSLSPKKSPKKEPEEVKKEPADVSSTAAAPTTAKPACSLFASMKKAGAVNSTASESTFCPDKPNYHPINDACWTKDQPVPYKALAQTLYCMEKTTKRLELLSIVCNYFRSVLALTPKDLVPSMYLLTNKVAPDYENIELGIGDTVLFKALAEATGSTLAKLKTEFQAKGDIGLVAEANRCNQKLIFTPKKLNVAGVHSKLKEIAQISGNASQTKKCEMIKGLFVSCDSIEARYMMRSLAGKLRNGLGEQSILCALAHACSTTPPVLEPGAKQIIDKFEKMRSADQIDEIKKKLEKSSQMVKNAYYQCPNYDRVIGAIIKYGLDELENHCKLTPGVPLRPMLAYPTKGIQEVLKRFDKIEFTSEYKYDGERAQVNIGEIPFSFRFNLNNLLIT